MKDVASVVARKDRLGKEEKSVPSTSSEKVTKDVAHSEKEEEENVEDEGSEEDVLGDEIADSEDEDDSDIEKRLQDILNRKEQQLKEQGELDSDDDEEDEDLFVDDPKPSSK